MLEFLNKPEYIFNPSQIVKRLFQKKLTSGKLPVNIQLTWGLPLKINPVETIGRTLYNAGVFELEVSETLWRLLDEGEKAIDIGANIGYMTSIIAVRLGSKGSIRCFEAHPEIYKKLNANTASWGLMPSIPKIETFSVAISDTEGSVNLYMSNGFENNEGIASIDFYHEQGNPITVPKNTLSHFVGADESIGFLKIDVEGHEAAVFAGCKTLLMKHQIRDILFEELGLKESNVFDILKECGYTVFFLYKGFFKVELRELVPDLKMPPNHAHNFLATIDPERAKRRMSKPGWQLFKRIKNNKGYNNIKKS